jgi:50S ribosomal protein L16 3-hydroxylase
MVRKNGRDYNPTMNPTYLEYPGLLGKLSSEEFLARYWQKKPLLVRGAIPGFGSGLSRDELLGLSERQDVESRFVAQDGDHWELRHGPFRSKEFRRRRTPWTVLVQSVNQVLPAGETITQAFDFIPYARLDDLMVSYATDGGGVGPHIDNYDVFLVQGLGRRRWRVGLQKDCTLKDGLPLRILKNFTPTLEWILEPGDMLYLPPNWAHDGVAVGECMTWSIGFRAAPAQEIGTQFLDFLQDRLCLDGNYRDPGLQQQKHPAEIGTAMIKQVHQLLAGIRWNKDTIRDFLGASLSEPKPQVVFDLPAKPLGIKQFVKLARRRGVRLDSRSRMLFSAGHFYLNGEREVIPRGTLASFRELADRRECNQLTGLPLAGFEILHAWYCDGYLHLKQ